MNFKHTTWVLLIILGSCDYCTSKLSWTEKQCSVPNPPIYHYPYLPQRPPLQHPRPPAGPTPQHTSPSPQDISSSTTIDQFDNRYPDGSYEYRYQLPDGTVRYERGYSLYIQHKKTLVVKGYYSYRLADQRYLTVFYTADQHGYRQNSSSFSWQRPILYPDVGSTTDSTWIDY